VHETHSISTGWHLDVWWQLVDTKFVVGKAVLLDYVTLTKLTRYFEFG